MARSTLKIAARRAGRLEVGEICEGEETGKPAGAENGQRWCILLEPRSTAVPTGQQTCRPVKGLAKNYPAYWESAKNSISSRGKFKAPEPDCYCAVCACFQHVIIQRSFWFYKYLAQTCAYTVYVCLQPWGKKRWRDLVTLHVWQLAAG